MIAARLYLAGGLALLIALDGWALYHQIGVSGELRAQLKQQVAATTAANDQVNAVVAEYALQNDLIVRARNERDAAMAKSQKVRTVVRTVMGSSAEPCVRAAVPDDVARAAQSALDELWQPRAAAGAGSEATPAAGAAARLPATGG